MRAHHLFSVGLDLIFRISVGLWDDVYLYEERNMGNCLVVGNGSHPLNKFERALCCQGSCWIGVEWIWGSNPLHTPKNLVLQDSNAVPDRVCAMDSNSWQWVGVWVRGGDLIKLINRLRPSIFY